VNQTPSFPLRIRDLPIAPLRMEEVLERVDQAISTGSRLRIGVVNAAKVVKMARDPLLRDDVMSSDLVLADGAAVVWAGRVLGRPLPERVAGIDLMTEILRRGEDRGYRVFCLGATADVLDKALARIAAEHPGVQVVGSHHGYFSDEEESDVAGQIDAARPDVLFVGMTSPRKERFLARWGDRLSVRVWHGVGGSLDILAGKVKRAPVMWQRLGLEWLFRVLQEPRRLWKRYLVTNALFCSMVLGELLAPRRGTRHS
jgi:N-acetylglucosaminyldiphosphoundecaprenol N-acetyl-beta-D-mannosaminyltransferase